ncbi:MAG: hypothetical protein ACHREM_06565 [Polyangiales bacterium]
MNADDESAKVRELREEARYWARQAKVARRKAEAAATRARDIERPVVTVRQGETWWSVYVNGERIDGHETQDVANTIAGRLRKAFELTKKKGTSP